MVSTIVFKTIRCGFESCQARMEELNKQENESTGISKLYKKLALDEKIVELRMDGWSYGAIQLKLGNPSKKYIKDVLKEYAPELLGDVVKNYNKL